MSKHAAFFARLSVAALLCLFASGLLAQEPNAALSPFEPASIVLPDAPPTRQMSEVRAILGDKLSASADPNANRPPRPLSIIGARVEE